ncbi:pentatricopeptide repeat-containing protein At3g03580 [Selaginella moellendorffii]|nr:pentatricopeptide repeat-containing protein At3g03580 [Selaginella moellendorffii]|eukprot:XP_002977329.2 pentatricopeptide repeat-containing protein At3g03580 [Selaginella moellendorffii]
MYGKCGNLDDARSVFDRIPAKNIYSWNIMLSAYQRAGCGVSALKLLREMDLDGVRPDSVTYVSYVTACSSAGAVEQGKFTHSRIAATGHFAADVSVGNSLVNMYGKFGLVEEARTVFESMVARNTVTWNTLIGAYTQNGHSREALVLYKLAKESGVKMSYVTYVVALGACSTLGQGREVHSDIVAATCELNATVENALIGCYSRCQSLEDARLVFNSMQCRKNAVSWNSMISACVANGRPDEALEIYRRMDSRPDRVTFMGVLGACSSLPEGREIQQRIKAEGLQTNACVANALITMYGRCGSLVDAREVFDAMPERDIISWNALINAHAQNGDGRGALGLYHELQADDKLEPDGVTFVAVLGACVACKDFKQSDEVSKRIIRSGIYKDDVVLATALVSMLGKFGEMEQARTVFSGMAKRTAISWNAMLAAYCDNGHARKALELYHAMDVDPDEVTYMTVAEACSSSRDLQEAGALHERAAASGMLAHVPLANALVAMYGKCQRLDEATRVFEGIPRRSLVSWNSMIAACVDNGENARAVELFKEMEPPPDDVTFLSVFAACSNLGDLAMAREAHGAFGSRELLDDTVGTSLVSMYGRCGSLADARAVFKRMPRRDATSWTSMIVACARGGDGVAGVAAFYAMGLEGVAPDEISFLAVLFCCSHTGLARQGREFFVLMLEELGARAEHYVCMVDLVGRLGWVEEAQKLLEAMPFQAGSIAWLALLGSCNVQRSSRRGALAAERVIELELEEARRGSDLQGL